MLVAAAIQHSSRKKYEDVLSDAAICKRKDARSEGARKMDEESMAEESNTDDLFSPSPNKEIDQEGNINENMCNSDSEESKLFIDSSEEKVEVKRSVYMKEKTDSRDVQEQKIPKTNKLRKANPKKWWKGKDKNVEKESNMVQFDEVEFKKEKKQRLRELPLTHARNLESICPDCGAAFPNDSKMLTHLCSHGYKNDIFAATPKFFEKYETGKLKCKICGSIIKSDGGILNHLGGSHGYVLELREKRLNGKVKSDDFQHKVCGVSLLKSDFRIPKVNKSLDTVSFVKKSVPVDLASPRLEEENVHSSTDSRVSPRFQGSSSDEEAN